MAGISEIVNARSYYHHLRTTNDNALYNRQAKRGLTPEQIDPKRSRIAARQAVERCNRMLVAAWMTMRTPAPKPQKVIRTGGIAYVLAWSNGVTHKYVPRTQYVPGSFRMVQPDLAARLLSELHIEAKVEEELRTADAMGDTPQNPAQE